MANREFRVLLVYPNLHMMLVPATAIGLFTSILRKQGFTVDLFDTTRYDHDSTVSTEKRVESLQYRPFHPETDIAWTKVPGEQLVPDFVAKVDAFKPDLILVSTVEDTFKQGLLLLDAIKERDIPTVVGGVFVTAAPDKALSYPQIKMVGLGEGENLVLSVATRLRDGQSLDNIPNLWLKKPDGTIIRNAMGPLIDINRPIPDFTLFDERRFLRPMGGRVFKTLPLETYRGCPFQCTFCNSPMQVSFSKDNNLGNFLRTKQASRIKDEIQQIIEKHQPEYFYILDDSFLSRPQSEIDAFIEIYSEVKIPFWFNTRPESVSAANLKALIEVGLDRLSVGVEHGNYEFRRHVLKRHPTNAQILEKLSVIADSGVAFSINGIIGFPGETRELMFETIELFRQVRGFDALTISIFTPYHGTELRDVAIKAGYLDADTMTTHTTSSSLLKMPNLTSEQIDGMFRTMLMYVRFEKELWPDVQVAESFTEEGNRMWRKLFELYQERYYAVDQDGVPLRQQLPPTDVTIKHPKGDNWEEVFGPMSKTQMR